MLVGRIVGSRPQTSGSPHWLLMVQPATPGHPPYRVAVNLQSTEPGSPPQVQYQVIDIGGAGTDALKALATKLSEAGPTASFLPGAPGLDFVRGGLLDPAAFQVNTAADPLRSAFEAALTEAAAADEAAGALLAVFGTGYPINPATGVAPSTGFQGVDNIHMNQGAANRTGAANHYRENGPNQDGGLIFLSPAGAKAIFVKFQSQSLNTDDRGDPIETGIARLDESRAPVHALLAGHAAFQAARTAASAQAVQPVPGESPAGFVFADPDPDDTTGQFMPDDDGGTYQTPFVMSFAKGQTRGPVPTPRGDPVMTLASVSGDSPAGYVRSPAGDETIAFDIIGDSGAVTEAKLTGEKAVGDLITDRAKADPPAFLFHVGDVVYYYGEKQFYYGQFANVFKYYPAPIFAIPGNHDGITYDASMVSLGAFQKAFCAEAPGRWEGFGGVLRSTMTQPGVFFTLDAPLVSIIGLYSNCGESLGWLDPQQLAFLHAELTRLGPPRAADGRAILLAIHHFPRWFGGATNDPTSDAIDAICQSLGVWPDAVLCGHAHLYQRIIRTVNGRSIPYFVVGAGGYGLSAMEEVGKAYVAANPSACVKLLEEGFLRARVTKAADGARTLSFAYNSVKRPAGQAADQCVIDLATGQAK
jgi:uncharacterized protein YukJ